MKHWTNNNKVSGSFKQVIPGLTVRDIIVTEKYKIYKLSKDVWTKDLRRFVCHLDESQMEMVRKTLKYPTIYYKRKLDILIEGHPASFEKVPESIIAKQIDEVIDNLPI